MSLDINKLENVKYRGESLIARCPACAQEGQDNKGEHLFIDKEGHFGCVLFPGEAGHSHRKIIFNLVGIKELRRSLVININKPKISNDPEIIIADVLGHLGRTESTPAQKESRACNGLETNVSEDKQNGVPNVPGDETMNSTPQ